MVNGRSMVGQRLERQRLSANGELEQKWIRTMMMVMMMMVVVVMMVVVMMRVVMMMLVSYFAGYPNTFSDDTVSPLAHRTACDCNGTAAHGLSGATGPTHLERSRELKLERKKSTT